MSDIAQNIVDAANELWPLVKSPPPEPYSVSVHIKLSHTDRNPASIFITYHQGDDHRSYRRPLDHRGIIMQFLASRPCSEDEVKRESDEWRMLFIKYDDWDKLIEDERKYTDSEAWFEQLNQLKSNYPDFKKTLF